MATKATPAILRSQSGETTRETASPAPTAIAEVATSARAEPTNTAHFELEPAERVSAASCVLSPSSARKIATKVEPKSFQSIRLACHARARSNTE